MPNGDREYRKLWEQVRDLETEKAAKGRENIRLMAENANLRAQVEALKASIRLLEPEK